MTPERTRLIAAAVVVLFAAWMLRYEIVPVGGWAYRLDRWTGQVELLRGTKRSEMDEKFTPLER